MTMKNIPIAIGFAVITASQFGLGMYMIALAAKMSGKVWFLDRGNHPQMRFFAIVLPAVLPQPAVPLDAYQLCLFVQPRTFEIAYTSITLFYGA